MREPWEEENLSRYYILSAFMEREGIEYAFFADTDVALNAPLPALPLQGCDTMVMFRNSLAAYADPFNWQVWAGTAILSRAVLSDFLAFVLRMYSEPHLGLLREKRDRSPFVCDMTLWYFYVAAASPALRERWGVPAAAALPSTPVRTFCSSGRMGYNNMIGDLDDGRQCPGPVRSIHFQGGSKELLDSYSGFARGQFD
jgi:hypothetical protein